MRQTLKTLSTLAFSRAIAEKAIEATEPTMVAERMLYRTMIQASMNALVAWPDKITPKDIRTIKTGLNSFCNTTGWENTGRHIQTYINFSLSLLEKLKESITDPAKIKAIDQLIDCEMAIYNRFSTGKDREYPLCLKAGLDAAVVWDKIMEAA